MICDQLREQKQFRSGILKLFHDKAYQIALASGQGPPLKTNLQSYKMFRETLTYFYPLFSNYCICFAQENE